VTGEKPGTGEKIIEESEKSVAPLGGSRDCGREKLKAGNHNKAKSEWL